MQHFDAIYGIIEDARINCGAAFIHCEMGVNRSGALVIAYIMVHNKWDPIRAATFFRDKRTRVMSNSNFQKQLIAFAIERELINSCNTAGLLLPSIKISYVC
jgi:dual specificity MAP kinase phosphatase/atypical dual specificity phosphatase